MKDRITVDRASQGVGASEIFSINSGKSIRAGKHFINTYNSTAQHHIETITFLDAHASSNTAIQHYDGPDFITNTDTLRSISQPTPQNIQIIASSVVPAVKHKSIRNGHTMALTNDTVNT